MAVARWRVTSQLTYAKQKLFLCLCRTPFWERPRTKKRHSVLKFISCSLKLRLSVKKLSDAASNRDGSWEQGGAWHVPPSGTAAPIVMSWVTESFSPTLARRTFIEQRLKPRSIAIREVPYDD